MAMSEHWRDAPFRDLTPVEKGYLHRLLEVEFPGRSEIRQQIESARARQIDADGSIEIVSQADIAARVEKSVPVQAVARDIDDVPIYFLLHVWEWRVHELEIYKADGTLIRIYPAPEDLDVMVLPG